MDDKNLIFSAPTSYGKTSIVINGIIKKMQTNINSIVVFILPTKALINDYRLQINRLNVDRTIQVVENPFDIYSQCNSIYLFTQERFIIFDSLNKSIIYDYIVVDEAQSLLNILSKDSQRSILLAKCLSIINSKGIPQIYLMPFIKNPYDDCVSHFITLNMKKTVVIQGVQSPTSSNKFVVCLDVHGFKTIEVNVWGEEDKESKHTEFNGKCEDIYDVKKYLFQICNTIGTETQKTLAYCAKEHISDFAKLYANNRVEKEVFTNREKALIKYLEEYIHPKFELINLLKKGIAIHMADLDAYTKRQIEKIFMEKESSLNFLLCTSTLAQGVNLNARNLLYLPPQGQFNNYKLDMKNLFGRVGRLGADLQGNIYKFFFDDGRNKIQTQEDFLIKAGDEYIVEKTKLEIKPNTTFNDIFKVYLADQDVENTFLLKTDRKIEKVDNLDYFLGIDKGKQVNEIVSQYNEAYVAELMGKMKMTIYDDCKYVLNELKKVYWETSTEFVEKYRMNNTEHLAIMLYNIIIGSSIYRSIEYMIKQHKDKSSRRRLYVFETMHHREYVKFIDVDKYFGDNEPNILKQPIREFTDNDINLLIYSYIYETQNIIEFRVKKYLQDFYYRLVKNKGKSVVEVENFLSYDVTDNRRVSLIKFGIVDSFAIDKLKQNDNLFADDEVKRENIIEYANELPEDEPLKYAIKDALI
jgi:hypothetical protein